VSILLGMSLPTTVVYVTLAVLVGPAMAQMGIVPLAAHLFLFYYGMLSLITPPDCLATYAAAAIAKSDFWTTGWVGMRLGIVAYLVPFVFVYHPALILKGDWPAIVAAGLTASIGVVLLGIAAILFRPLGWGKRLDLATRLLLFMPPLARLPSSFDVLASPRPRWCSSSAPPFRGTRSARRQMTIDTCRILPARPLERRLEPARQAAETPSDVRRAIR
jgi:TRAP-type uncharacterized transport system fused permease subunit